MMKITLSVILCSLLLTACAQAPVQDNGDQHAIQQDFDGATVPHAMPDAISEQSYPKLELNSQLLYTFLLADIAAQRGQRDLAAQAYMKLAKETRDVRVARRAAQLAYESRQMEYSIEAFTLWHELEPKAVLPRQMLATVLLSGGKLEEARPYIVELLAADAANAGRNFVQLYPLFGRFDDKLAVYRMLQELAQPYPNVAEMPWVLAQAAETAARHDEALREVRRARSLRPAWELSVLLEAQLLQAKTPFEALSVLKKYLDEYPEANEVRLFYARALLEQKQYPESRTQFQQLLKKKPANADLAFAIALLSLQMGELDRAERELKQALDSGKKDSASVHYYLAQLNEAKNNGEAALQEYRQVTEGEHFFQSRLRMAFLLAKAKRMNEAREVLHQTESKNNQQLAQLILTEGQLLRDARQYDQAFHVLSKGLEKMPEQADLMYEAAMVADKLGKFSTFEAILRKLIKIDPEHAHAYNALGYSLLEHKVRLAEAMRLLEKANQLAPEDPAIMDSMGWGHYLTGNLPLSEKFLRRAYAAFPDAEIAAHLGEVLWQRGEREEANKIWQDSLKKTPDSSALKAVIKKFAP